jgi:hypothetical protein
MRTLLPAVVFALFAPLSACYTAGPSPAPRPAPTPEPESVEAPEADAGAPAEPDPEPRCRDNAECGDDGACVGEGSAAHCILVPRDAGTDTAPDPCANVCAARRCGVVTSVTCGAVSCGSCGAGLVCNDGSGACEAPPYTGPIWAVRVLSARVDRCDTDWDRCVTGNSVFCAPSLPDPFVRVNGVVTAPAGNRCEGRYDVEVGVLEEPRLAQGVGFVLEDDDSAITNVRTGDVVCRGVLTATATELAAGAKTVPCAGGSVTFTFARRR